MRKSPCYSCTERYRACHDSCQRYADWIAPFHEGKKTYQQFNDFKFNSEKRYMALYMKKVRV